MPLITLVTKEKIESIFQPILGEPLNYMTRYFGRQRLDFGALHPRTTRKGREYTFSTWRLAISCNWCITSVEGKIVSDADFEAGDERSDESAYSFYDSLEKNPPCVKQVQADDNGNLRFVMTGDIVLEANTLPATGQEEWSEHSEPLIELFEEGEQWRLTIDAHNKSHYDDVFVWTSRGLIEFRHEQVEQFFAAVRADDLATVETMLKQGMKPWSDPDSGESTMQFAATRGSKEMARLLLEHGIEPHGY